MDKLFAGLAMLRPGVMLTLFGVLLIGMSGVETIGSVVINAQMAEKLFYGGMLLTLLGAYFSWYRGKKEAELNERRK